MEEITLKFDNIGITLNKINYTKISDEPVVGKVQIITKDFYNITKMNLNGFSVYYERKINLEPNVLFEMCVGFDIDYFFAKEISEKFKNSFEELKKVVEMKEDKPIGITNVISQASAIISSITTYLGLNPIITPPNFIK